jgi:hypothetical protein
MDHTQAKALFPAGRPDITILDHTGLAAPMTRSSLFPEISSAGVGSIDLDKKKYATHVLRGTKAALLSQKMRTPRAVRLLPAHTTLESGLPGFRGPCRLAHGRTSRALTTRTKYYADKASCLSARRREYIPAGLTAASLRPSLAARSNHFNLMLSDRRYATGLPPVIPLAGSRVCCASCCGNQR